MESAGEIRVIIFKEDEHWVAQCLEYDIGAQANDLETLNLRLRLALFMEAQESVKINGKPFEGIDKAPPHFFDMWEKRSGQFNPLCVPDCKDNATEPTLNYALRA